MTAFWQGQTPWHVFEDDRAWNAAQRDAGPTAPEVTAASDERTESDRETGFVQRAIQQTYNR